MASKQMIAQALASIRTLYPTFAKDDEDIKTKAMLWERLLAQYADEDVSRALYLCLQDMKYPPVPADIIERLRPNKAQMWAELYDALCKVDDLIDRMTYASADERAELRDRISRVWNGLSPEVKAYCGNESQMRVMSQMTDRDLQFERGNFMRADLRVTADKMALENGGSIPKIEGK